MKSMFVSVHSTIVPREVWNLLAVAVMSANVAERSLLPQVRNGRIGCCLHMQTVLRHVYTIGGCCCITRPRLFRGKPSLFTSDGRHITPLVARLRGNSCDKVKEVANAVLLNVSVNTDNELAFIRSGDIIEPLVMLLRGGNFSSRALLHEHRSVQ
jgi:hypothetical protein